MHFTPIVRRKRINEKLAKYGTIWAIQEATNYSLSRKHHKSPKNPTCLIAWLPIESLIQK